jgi:hypothetical protein
MCVERRCVLREDVCVNGWEWKFVYASLRIDLALIYFLECCVVRHREGLRVCYAVPFGFRASWPRAICLQARFRDMQRKVAGGSQLQTTNMILIAKFSA